MIDFIAILIVLLLLGAAITYIVKEKKKGVKCIGCPSAGQCSAAKTGKASDSECGSCHGCDISYEEIKDKLSK